MSQLGITKIEFSYLSLGGPAHGVLNVGKVILQRLKFAFNLWTISDVVSSSQARKTSTHLVDDGLGGVHAVVVSLEEGLILGLGALLGAGVGLASVAGLPDESAAVVAEFEDAPHADVGGGIGEGEGQGEEEGDEKCETRLHRVGLTEQSQI